MDVASIVFPCLGSFYAVGAGIKSWTWWRSLRWALEHGPDYAEAVQAEAGTISRERRFDLIRIYDGEKFWPGAKSSRLWKPNPDVRGKVLKVGFLNTPIFIMEGAILAGAAALAHDSSAIVRVVAVLIAFWIAWYSLALMVEAIVWYVIAKDFSLVWGDVKFASEQHGKSSKALGDFKGLGAITVTVVLSSSVLVSTIAECYQGFQNLNSSAVGIPTLVGSTYYVLATMSTVGDNTITPANTLARSGAAVVHLAVLVTISFVISAITARLQNRT